MRPSDSMLTSPDPELTERLVRRVLELTTAAQKRLQERMLYVNSVLHKQQYKKQKEMGPLRPKKINRFNLRQTS